MAYNSGACIILSMNILHFPKSLLMSNLAFRVLSKLILFAYTLLSKVFIQGAPLLVLHIHCFRKCFDFQSLITQLLFKNVFTIQKECQQIIGRGKKSTMEDSVKLNSTVYRCSQENIVYTCIYLHKEVEKIYLHKKIIGF